MSFFDEIDDFEELIETESETDFGNALHSNVGDIVYYDPTSYQFMTASAFDSSKINVNCIDENWRTIMLGVVIRQYEDLSVDVLMSGFLMSEPLRLPIKYYYKDKRKFIRPYVYNMFKRYVRAFFKQCPEYDDLLEMNIEMPSVADMMIVHQNLHTIFSALRVCADEDKFNEYFKRLYNSFIYVTHKHKIYQMKITADVDEKPVILYPEPKVADFMCVFRNIKIFNFNKNNEVVSRKQE